MLHRVVRQASQKYEKVIDELRCKFERQPILIMWSAAPVRSQYRGGGVRSNLQEGIEPTAIAPPIIGALFLRQQIVLDNERSRLTRSNARQIVEET